MPSSSSSAYGGRPPSAGDFATRSPVGEHVTGRKRRAATSFFPIFRERRLLARERPLDAVADRGGDTVQVADELAHPLRHQRERVVGALRRVARREVLLDHARAEHVRDERHRDAVLVVGEADDELRVALAVRRDHAELELLDGGRVGRRALQQAELRVDRRHGLDGAVDVLDRRAAGGDDHRLADRGDVAQERRVAEVAGGDLVGRHVELGEQVGARLVERRREEHEAELAGARLQLDVGAAIELERLAVRAVRRAEAVLVVVGAVVERAGVQAPVVALLELDRVHARLLREHEQLLRLLDRALVVVADLGDDEARRVVGDPAAVDLELAHRAIVPLRFAGARADTERVRSETPDRVPPVASSLSILMPVYNELATVERAIDDALTAELPVESRQLVLVDDGSTDGTRELLQGRELPENVTLVLPRAEPGQGRGAADRRSSTRPAPGPRCSTPTSSTAPRTSGRCSSRSSPARRTSSSARARGRASPRSASGT